MKKIKVIIALLPLLSAGFTSCVGKEDFDTGKTSLSELHPVFFLPLIQDTLTLNSRSDITGEGDSAEIFYDMENIRLPGKDGWFSIPDINVNLPVRYTGTGNVDVTLPPLSFPLLPGNGQELDSLGCSGLPVRIAFSGLPALGLVEITFPQIFVNGQPYTANVTATTNLNIPACKIVPKDKKKLEVTIRLKGTVPAALNASLNIQIQNIRNHYTGLFGYFGQHTAAVKDSIVLNIMDDLNITATSLEFDILKVKTSTVSSMGIPFRLTLTEVKAYGQDGLERASRHPNQSIDVLAPGYYDENRVSITGKTIRFEGFGDILHKDTRKIVFSFTCTSNPNGNSGSRRNFLTPADAIQSSVSARIPLFVKATDLVLQDTIGLNMSSILLEELKLQMYLENSMPVAARFNIWLLDENNVPSSTPFIKDLSIDRPDIDNNGIATNTTNVQQSVSISKTLFGQLRKSTHALATVNIDTGTGYVRFMKNSSLYTKVGAEVKFTYKDLLK
ncbi:MAG: hypothetical protein LBN98_04710 [Prevotellaceae bacterium]|jgi:hypothetical protein|nr:hypothetical protein [Prevotellaceae bacterium]